SRYPAAPHDYNSLHQQLTENSCRLSPERVQFTFDVFCLRQFVFFPILGFYPKSVEWRWANNFSSIARPTHSEEWVFYFGRQKEYQMIISMRPHATKAEIDYVCERIREFGYKVHSIEGEERVVIGVVGVGDVTACLE